MKVTIISPTTSYEYEVSSAEFTTPGGTFVVLPGHAPLIATSLPNSKSRLILLDGSEKHIPIKSGIIRVDRNAVTVLITQE